MAKRHNVEMHFISYHKTFSASSPGSTLRGAFGKQQSYFTTSLKQSKATKHFGWQFAKGIMAVVATTLFKDEKNGKDIIADLLGVQLSANTFQKSVSDAQELD